MQNLLYYTSIWIKNYKNNYALILVTLVEIKLYNNLIYGNRFNINLKKWKKNLIIF